MNLSMSFRTVAVSAVLAGTAASASATGITIPVNAFVADSIQEFSIEANANFRQVGIKVTSKGNASTNADKVNSFTLPVTAITVSPLLKILSGTAQGSALQFDRIGEDEETGEEIATRLTLANFTINYTTHQVLADATPLGGTPTKQVPIFNFKTLTPLGLKYKFPLNITGNEVLGDLALTPEAKELYKVNLKLPSFVFPLLDTLRFGTLTQNITTKLRSTPVSTKPYVPAP